MPDYGTGRCDFPQGNAEDLYDSIQKLYALPDATRAFTGRDYQPSGRPLGWQSTIAEEKAQRLIPNGSTASCRTEISSLSIMAQTTIGFPISRDSAMTS